MISRGDGNASVLDAPHPSPLLRRPEPQGEACFTPTLWRCLADGLPGRDAPAPTLRRRGRALNR